MKRLLFFTIILISSVICVFLALRDKPQNIKTEIYVVDSELMRLIPIETDIIQGAPEFMAKQAVTKLIIGYDNNRKIRRLIPNSKKSLTVAVKGSRAEVNINSAVFKESGISINSRDIEKLFIYQLVNTLSSISGIETVTFTIDGKTEKRFAGFADMREIFVADYMV